jgi:hypothetical protein
MAAGLAEIPFFLLLSRHSDRLEQDTECLLLWAQRFVSQKKSPTQRENEAQTHFGHGRGLAFTGITELVAQQLRKVGPLRRLLVQGLCEVRVRVPDDLNRGSMHVGEQKWTCSRNLLVFG